MPKRNAKGQFVKKKGSGAQSGGRRRRKRRMGGGSILGSVHNFVKDKKLVSQGLNAAAPYLPGPLGGVARIGSKVASMFGYGQGGGGAQRVLY